jgi:hypothetical protein
MNTGYNNIRYRDPRLGRFQPTDEVHLQKYPLTAATMPKAVPIIIGVNWYSNFDKPAKDRDGSWWVGKDKNNLGSIRGGHAVCIPHDPKLDTYAWYLFYNQINEGKCVSEAGSRMMSIFNRKRYDVDYAWNWAKDNDEWAETNSGDNNGTSVRAMMDFLRTLGHKKVNWTAPKKEEGIIANRWATSINDALEATGNETYKKKGAMPFLNSWGKDYPRLVWMPCETHEILLNQFGEYGIPTDR